MTLLIAAFVGSAYPCAGLFHATGALAESDAQQIALVQVDDSTVEATFQVQYDGDAPDFGWVIPIVGEVESVEDGADSLFSELAEETAPSVSWNDADDEASSSGGLGCGSRNKSSDFTAGGADTGGLGADVGVDVLAEGFSGTYSWSVLEADSGDALQSWLDENGWSIGASGPAIEAYVAEGAQFVAIALAADDAYTPDAGRALPPLAIRYAGALRYPALMGYYGDLEELRTTIYVIGESNAALSSGWTDETLGTIYGELDEDPDALYEAALRELGREATFARVASTRWGDQRVTRFDTLAPRAAHAVDPNFAFDGSAEDLETHVWLEEGYSAATIWWLAPLLGLGIYRRR